MRKSIAIICAVVLILCLWLLLHQKNEPMNNSPSEVQVLSSNHPAVSQTAPIKTLPMPKQASDSNSEVIHHRPTLTEITNLQQQLLEDWQRPIEFYGKVIDENSNTVMGANISFQWVESPYGENTRHITTQSDANGLFSLQSARGPTLSVTVNKEGYYTSRSTSDSFRYDGSQPFQASSIEPVAFHLRKKGQGAELITSDNGMRPDVWVRLPKDNTPVHVDFFQKQPSASGQLEISQVKPPFQVATNWSFRMSIPDGGLVENQDEFQFAAPESGYQPTVVYDFTKGETNWTAQVSKQFYIAFGQPRKYGWLRIESNLAQETIFLTYAINPNGSRNLEPQ